MSPQASLCISKNGENCFSSCDEGVEHASRRVSYSTSRLVRDVGEAFHGQMSQHHGLAPSDDLASKSNPLREASYGIHLKKRKCNLSENQSTFNSDFLSGIFQDLAEATSHKATPMSSGISEAHLIDNESIASSRPNKRARFSSSSLSSTKSFSNLTAQISESDSTVSSSLSSLPVTQASAEVSNPVTMENTAEKIVDTVFNNSFCNIGFPCLPTAVSESSCSSNNLTQTAVHAAQVLETPLNSNVEGEQEERDEYGWFVEMDEDSLHQRFDAVDDAAKNCRAMASEAPADLTFVPTLTPKKPKIELDSEVEWAKAADTVDDVLGAVFF